MLFCPGAEIRVYREQSPTSDHSWCISQDVGNCHNSLRVVLGECQSLTCALTSARGPLWSGVLRSQSLHAVIASCICDSDKFSVSGVELSWAELHWPERPSRITSSDRSAVIQLNTVKLDRHFLLQPHIQHAKSLTLPSELRGWTAMSHFCWEYLGTCLKALKDWDLITINVQLDLR